MAVPYSVQGILALLVVLVYYQYARKKTKLNLPPGPKPIPILGNIRDLPPTDAPDYQHWLNHKDLYGPISSVTVLGRTIVILHDKQAAFEVLEKTAKKTSDRPAMEFARELCGFKIFLPGLDYNEEYRLQRRLIHQQLGTKSAITRYHEILVEEVQHFLVRVSRHPEDMHKLFKDVTGAIILKMTYGYSIDQEKEDYLVNLIWKMMTNLSTALLPMRWLVDIIPGLKYLLGYLPGMTYKKIARRSKEVNQAVAEVPYLFTQKKMDSPTHRPSYVSRLLQQSKDSSEKRTDEENVQLQEAIKYTAAIMFAGGADTSASNLSSFLLAMAMYPEVQRRAQQEIDTVVGPDRLPRFEDQDRLPYIEGMVKEALRWLPVTPMGTAHAASEATVCGGYDIPKGAALIPAIWWFTHDPDVYRDPEAFDPDRYSPPRSEPDPRSVVFGFGRRVCPGKFLADSKLFLIISNLLALFEISKAVDDKGAEIDVKLEPLPGLISHPADFPYRIKPRNAQSSALLRRIETEHPWQGSDAEFLEEMNLIQA